MDFIQIQNILANIKKYKNKDLKEKYVKKELTT